MTGNILKIKPNNTGLKLLICTMLVFYTLFTFIIEHWFYLQRSLRKYVKDVLHSLYLFSIQKVEKYVEPQPDFDYSKCKKYWKSAK